MPIRVILADDHAVVRRSLRRLLDEERDVEVVAEVDDVPGVLHHVAGHAPHVLVLDLQTPSGSSVEMIKRVRGEAPDTEVVVLTMEPSPLFAEHALDAGAIAFVLKDRADSELSEAIRLAARGVEYVSPQVADALAALRQAVGGNGLSLRETEILRLIALGFTSAEIADQLHLSRRTVETHRARIHQKLGTTTRAELVRYALGHHLVGT